LAIIFAILVGPFTALSINETEIAIINPETTNGNFTFSAGATPVGTRFNATAWAYDTANMFAYQVYVSIDDSLLNITNAWLPTWDSNWVFTGKTTVRPAPAFYDMNTNSYMESVKIGDSMLIGDPYTGSGLLAIIEFEIIYVPATGLASCNLAIDNVDTFVLDYDLNEVDTAKTDGYYEIAGEPGVQYELTIEVEGLGTTNPAPGKYMYNEGIGAAVDAQPQAGWELDHWLLDDVDVGAADPYTVTMDANHTLKAVFVEAAPPVQYELEILVEGEGTTNPAPGTYMYDEDNDVPVDALPESGFELDYWLLDDVDVGAADPYTVTMDENHTLKAVFKEIPPGLVGIIVLNPATMDSNFVFSADTSPVGTRFNASIWLDDAIDLFAYQVYLAVDDTLLNITYAWLPTTDPTWVFAGKTTVQPGPVLYDLDVNGYFESVKIGDSMLIGDPVTGSGLLAIIEFEITYVPTEGAASSTLDINYDDTYALNYDLNEMEATKTNGYYEIGEGQPPPTEEATIFSCDSNGYEKNAFGLDETVYACGEDFDPWESVKIHVVKSNGPYTVVAAIYSTTATADVMGNIAPTSLGTYNLGEYDIWVDRNCNEVLDETTEPVDTFGQVGGFLVIPDFLLGSILSLSGFLAAFGVFSLTKRRSRKNP